MLRGVMKVFFSISFVFAEKKRNERKRDCISPASAPFQQTLVITAFLAFFPPNLPPISLLFSLHPDGINHSHIANPREKDTKRILLRFMTITNNAKG